MLRGLNKVIKAKHLEQWLELNMWALVISTGNAKECSNYQTIALISHASKVTLKILQARLQNYMNQMYT